MKETGREFFISVALWSLIIFVITWTGDKPLTQLEQDAVQTKHEAKDLAQGLLAEICVDRHGELKRLIFQMDETTIRGLLQEITDKYNSSSLPPGVMNMNSTKLRAQAWAFVEGERHFDTIAIMFSFTRGYLAIAGNVQTLEHVDLMDPRFWAHTLGIKKGKYRKYKQSYGQFGLHQRDAPAIWRGLKSMSEKAGVNWQDLKVFIIRPMDENENESWDEPVDQYINRAFHSEMQLLELKNQHPREFNISFGKSDIIIASSKPPCVDCHERLEEDAAVAFPSGASYYGDKQPCGFPKNFIPTMGVVYKNLPKCEDIVSEFGAGLNNTHVPPAA